MRRLFSYTAYGKITYAYGSAISIGDFAINCVSTPPSPAKKKRAEALFIISIPVFDEPS